MCQVRENLLPYKVIHYIRQHYNMFQTYGSENHFNISVNLLTKYKSKEDTFVKL